MTNNTFTNQLTNALEQFPQQSRTRLAEVVLAEPFGGLIPAELAQTLSEELGLSTPALMLALVPLARCYAHPPISDFFVGAVVQGSSGDLIFGANLEFPGTALNTTVHAEQAAVLHAWQRGETGITAIAVNGSPCGHCRQFLTEINNPQLTVITPKIDSQPIHKLLPDAFTPGSLGNTSGLMDPVDHGLALDSVNHVAEPDDLLMTALQMANHSYAPYSQNHAGVAVRTEDGMTFGASYAENVAFNPSLSPLNGVLVVMRMQSHKWNTLREAVLVEAAESRCSQEPATRALLATLGDVSLRVVNII